jgi:hypothetical protein
VVFVINLPCPSLGVLIKLLSSRDIGRYNTWVFQQLYKRGKWMDTDVDIALTWILF